MADYRRVFEDGYSYYITIVTYHRRSILIDNIALLRKSFQESKHHFDYTIDAIMVMPDHLHMIITPRRSDEYPKIIGYIKAYFSRHFDDLDSQEHTQTFSRHRHRHRAVWQKRYYEHTIRNEKDWIDKTIYMQNNPVKHGLVDEVRAWRYSSFFVRNQW
jgi:putative transposase